jgi:antitoxin HigA-1
MTAVRSIPYPHPGEILQEEFLTPFGMTQYRLAKSIDVKQTRISEIIAGRRGISADTALRLSRFFGTSEGFWMNLQMAYDTAKARDELAAVLAKIEPYHHVA